MSSGLMAEDYEPMGRRTEITIETERVLIIGSHNTTTIGWCAGCETYVRMIVTDLASRLSGLSQRSIYQSIEAGRLHFVETRNQQILVCEISLKRLSKGSPNSARLDQ
jgi:hypothetical protein